MSIPATVLMFVMLALVGMAVSILPFKLVDWLESQEWFDGKLMFGLFFVMVCAVVWLLD